MVILTLIPGHRRYDNEVIYAKALKLGKTIFKRFWKRLILLEIHHQASSTPEPAEAEVNLLTNTWKPKVLTKMAMGVLALGVGAVALLGGDRIRRF